MLEPALQKEIESIARQEIETYMRNKQYTVSKIPNHEHNGSDTKKLNPANFLGFPIINAVPTDKAPNGTIRIYRLTTTYRLYVRVNNLWKYATLT